MKDIRTYILEGFKLGKNKVKKEEDYVNLELPSGTLWCKYNVGATCEDDVESWYGDYFAWGDPEPVTNKICNWNNYKYTTGSPGYLTKYCTNEYYWGGNGKPDNKLELDEEDDIASINMGGDWKMPTKEQCEELLDNTISKWVRNYNNIQGLNGILFISKINNNELFFPAAGYRNLGAIRYRGSGVRVWSSTVGSSTRDSYGNFSANYIDIERDDTYIYSIHRYLGFSVRGVIIK